MTSSQSRGANPNTDVEDSLDSMGPPVPKKQVIKKPLNDKLDIERHELEEYLPYFFKLIEECDFVTLDFEFTGVGNNPTGGRVDRNNRPTLAERYKEQRESAEVYRIMEMGICPVKWNPASEFGPGYAVRPFNFPISPFVGTGLCDYDRVLSFSAQALHFHAKNEFDFNKLFYKGCIYLGHEEEAHIRMLRQQRDEADKIEIEAKPEDVPMLEDVKAQILAWEKRKSRIGCNEESVNIVREELFNGYQRRLIHQYIRREFPDLIGIWLERGQKHFVVRPYDPEREQKILERQRARFEKAIKGQRGLRLLIDKIMETKKPLVGHNLFTDLIYLHRMFIGTPPEDVEGFRKSINQHFGQIVDTKFLALNLDHSNRDVVSSSLPELGNKFANQAYPRIEDNYIFMNKARDHIASYDAWNTAQCFVKLASLMYHAGSDNPTPPREASPLIDNRKREIAAALATRPPRAGYSRLVEMELSDKTKIRFPHWSSNFWKVFGGRLIVNGTIEGEFTLI
ncbi:hypothetical protein TWF730_007674 [Orbilia blumenaviensis]|uniref:Uncharacterized protein n=1 Tax=Orbilia blumenaviensis TaxID=1796055 RepID=A0AAV9V980_9PEZI